ncbi:MAG: hypothetical protein ACI89J_004053 [Hyphomicrobiaceae bacterium]
MWQALYAENQGHNFTVVTVAMDSPEAARPWIEAVNPSYPCLIDRDHRVAELYNMVNVPQAVWIDEAGLIVRPPENAGSSDAFRFMDRETKQMTPEQVAERESMKSKYVNAVRNWIAKGSESEHVLEASMVRSRVRLPDDNIALAHAHFRLARYLRRESDPGQAAVHFSKASELHPDSWNIWRQAAEKDATGLAVGPEFWARVDALANRPYHLPVDI